MPDCTYKYSKLHLIFKDHEKWFENQERLLMHIALTDDSDLLRKNAFISCEKKSTILTMVDATLYHIFSDPNKRSSNSGRLFPKSLLTIYKDEAWAKLFNHIPDAWMMYRPRCGDPFHLSERFEVLYEKTTSFQTTHQNYCFCTSHELEERTIAALNSKINTLRDEQRAHRIEVRARQLANAGQQEYEHRVEVKAWELYMAGHQEYERRVKTRAQELFQEYIQQGYQQLPTHPQ